MSGRKTPCRAAIAAPTCGGDPAVTGAEFVFFFLRGNRVRVDVKSYCGIYPAKSALGFFFVFSLTAFRISIPQRSSHRHRRI